MQFKVIACILVYAASAALGDPPTSRPAGPREVVRSFLTAVRDGHPDDIAGICAANDAASKKIVDDLKNIAKAMGTIHQAAVAKYGADVADLVRPMMGDPDEAMDESITDDRAAIESDDGTKNASLVRIGGQWKMDIAAMNSDGEFGADADGYLSELARVIEKTAAEISDGKFDGAVMARDVLRARQEGIGDRATTRPAADK